MKRDNLKPTMIMSQPIGSSSLIKTHCGGKSGSILRYRWEKIQNVLNHLQHILHEKTKTRRLYLCNTCSELYRHDVPTHRVKRKFKQRVLQLQQTWAMNKIKLKRGKVLSATWLADLRYSP